MKPIVIASKGRPEASTLKTLADASLTALVIVEPQDADQYRKADEKNGWGNEFLILPKSDGGLAFARDAALEAMRQRRQSWYWLLDDDISGFYKTIRRKTEKTRADEVLEEAEKRFALAGSQLGIGSLEYQQYAWNAKTGQIAMNSYCDVAVFINTSTSAKYRPETGLKVDRDFTLLVLSAGRTTIRLRDLSFSAPTNGSNKGGLYDEYKTGIEEKHSRVLAELWPGIVTYHKKPNGRPDAKIDWKFFKTKHEATRI
jgi:hypothetical protein